MRRLLLLLLLAPLAGWLFTSPAVAHDATSTAYADVTGSGSDVRVVLDLEYDLLMKSAWLYADAYRATDRAEQERQLGKNFEAVSTYVVERFQVANGDQRCVGRTDGTGSITSRNDRAFVRLSIDYACPTSSEARHAFYSSLFPDEENFVHSTKTVLTYDVDGHTGAVTLDPGNPQLDVTDAPEGSVTPSSSSRAGHLWEFGKLGAEHLLLGPDHLLFLLALLLGVRGWREVLLAATAFTVAHSVTFALGSLGLVTVSPALVEPVIALSIVVVAVLGLVSSRWSSQPGRQAEVSRPHSRWQLPVAFGFGLLHGLGFASALGIDEPGSWELVWSLLAFNVGIEVAQVGLILLAFPVILALRRTKLERPVLTGVAVAVILVGSVWVVQRLPVTGDHVAGALPWLGA
ncbi:MULTISPECIES: HupE/UreJ family protein [unclassified Nocardioides]|uniref:HupE/UreJ family protein n=1 Tax=unclassified Nocardioides TaxID=2615069 RepID=UPI0006F5DD2E|nr:MULTISPECIES: HupE/UreJ family protein [unclassified Nocardioides]KQY55462.1 hypothetical protein ASD30_16270 [Nocardioides sp. Root140]KRF12802.1 hypothetical protein ASH02_14850 [Nocardioides sp. Soil796]